MNPTSYSSCWIQPRLHYPLIESLLTSKPVRTSCEAPTVSQSTPKKCPQKRKYSQVHVASQTDLSFGVDDNLSTIAHKILKTCSNTIQRRPRTIYDVPHPKAPHRMNRLVMSKLQKELSLAQGLIPESDIDQLKEFQGLANKNFCNDKVDLLVSRHDGVVVQLDWMKLRASLSKVIVVEADGSTQALNQIRADHAVHWVKEVIRHSRFIITGGRISPYNLTMLCASAILAQGILISGQIRLSAYNFSSNYSITSPKNLEEAHLNESSLNTEFAVSFIGELIFPQSHSSSSSNS